MGNSWLDRWNPDIDRRGNTVTIKVGKLIVVLNGVQEKENKEKLSNVFRRETMIKEISPQSMRRLAQKEPVYLAVVRSVESNDVQKEVDGDHIVEVNEDKAKTPYPKEVQEILTKYLDVFLRIFQ